MMIRRSRCWPAKPCSRPVSTPRSPAPAARRSAPSSAQKPDLVLLDVELPGSNGFDLCATLRLLSPGVDVPIVMVTGHNDTASIAQAYQVGATDFIHKPVLWPTLPHRIGFILRAQDNLRALKISEQKNRALLQALPDTIYIVDADGVLLEHITGDDRRNGASLVGKQLENDIAGGRGARRARRPTARISALRASLRIRLGRGKEQRCIRDPTASAVRRHAADHHPRHHRAPQGQGPDRISGLLRHPHRPAEPPAVRARGRAAPFARPSRAASRWPCCTWIWIASSASMTTSAIRWAMRCCKNVARRLEQSIRPTDTASPPAEQPRGAAGARGAPGRR